MWSGRKALPCRRVNARWTGPWRVRAVSACPPSVSHWMDHDEKIFLTPWCVWGVWRSLGKWPFVVVGGETPADGAKCRPLLVLPLLLYSLPVVRSSRCWCCPFRALRWRIRRRGWCANTPVWDRSSSTPESATCGLSTPHTASPEVPSILEANGRLPRLPRGLSTPREKPDLYLSGLSTPHPV
jgi:hypothetical protein